MLNIYFYLKKMTNLSSLFLELGDKEYKGTDTCELFTEFYKTDGKKVKKWINEAFKTECNNKCDNESDKIRKEGNKCYVNGEWNKSLEYYIRALSKAHHESESYAMALANRSATLFSMEEYKYSLLDIDRCLKCSYPDKLRYKIYMRKIQCFDKIGVGEKAEKSLKEGLEFITNNVSFTEDEKEKYKNKLSHIERLPQTVKVTRNYECEIPKITDNDRFSGASSLVGLRYNSEKGRHVVAECDINTGDILFVEKAFATAPAFNENCDLLTNKCYYCLLDNKALIPCFYCSISLYCNEDCRTKSWNEFHKWECKGMSINLWCTVSLGFPAFRVLLKGISSFPISDNGDHDNLDVFQSKIDTYKSAYYLAMNISKRENNLEFLMFAAIVVYYLETQTSFFKWLSDQTNMENNNNLKIFFGSVLLRHISQIACNASAIEHWKINNYQYVPLDKIAVAVGLYPSVSMMNHSCKPNISIYYINDVAVVKAKCCIKKNEEVFNCYGVDYRYSTRKERQSTLAVLYQFQCSCEICQNPKLELDYLDTFRCAYCSGAVWFDVQKCHDCERSIDTSKILFLEREMKKYLEKEPLRLEDINIYYNIMKKIYNKYHMGLAECYDLYKTYYLKAGQFEEAIEYFNKSLELKKKHWGKYSLGVAGEILTFLHVLKSRHIIDKKELFIQGVKNLYGYLENIFLLNYPDNYINYDTLKTLAQ